MDDLDARSTIIEALSTVHGPKKRNGDTVFIVCPFHGDTDPSLGVHVGDGHKVPLGTFNCFGCPESGHWNKLARQLDLPKIKDWQMFTGTSNDALVEQAREMLKSNSLEDQAYSKDKLCELAKTNEAIDWPIYQDWRGYPGKLIRKMRGLYFNDPAKDELMLLFPVIVNNKLRGGVKAMLEKPKKGLSYLTTDGSWAKKYGLFGFDFAKKIMKKKGYRFVIVVEGPRDCLRLLKAGLPAVAILGSQNYSEKKMMLLTNITSDLDRIYVLPDNDGAGKSMAKLVKRITKPHCRTIHIKLPRKKKKGKLIKMDPDDMPREILKEIKRAVVQANKKAA